MSLTKIKHFTYRFSHMNFCKNILVLIGVLLSAQGYAQIGFRLSYEHASYDDWASVSGKSDLLSKQYSVGVEYWYRLKNVRVEFFPELYLLSSKDQINDAEKFDYSIIAPGLSAKTHFYIMDFYGDCDCPTFSKQGNFLTKGFYLALAPGVQSDFRQLSKPDEELDMQSMNIHFKLNLGAGLDIGIMDSWTISPFIFYNITPIENWKGFSSFHDPAGVNNTDDKSIQRAIQSGIRLHYRWRY